MPTFSYVAINEQGKEISGSIEASDPSSAEKAIEEQDLLPIKVTQGGNSTSKSSGKGLHVKKGKRRKVSDRDVIDFSRQLVTLIRAGVPILSSLETLAGQAENPAFSEILMQVASDIAAGNDFSAALGKHPKIFNELYANSVKAGEVGGVLDEVLDRLTSVMQRDAEIRKSVKGAMRYPVIVISMMAIAFMVLTGFVVPKFAKIFVQVGLDLPLPTVVLIWLANFLQAWWWLLLVLVGGGLFVLRTYIKTEKGAVWWDGFLLYIPIFGPLVLKTAMTRFTKMFETLSRSGLPILQIFDVVSRTIGNKVVGDALVKASEGIEHGRGVAVSLANTGLFPPLVIRMITVGEESGAIDDMLANISEYYDQEVKSSVDGMTALIEPMLTVGMAVMVLLFALAIFLPMWDMMQMAQQGP